MRKARVGMAKNTHDIPLEMIREKWRYIRSEGISQVMVGGINQSNERRRRCVAKYARCQVNISRIRGSSRMSCSGEQPPLAPRLMSRVMSNIKDGWKGMYSFCSILPPPDGDV